MKQLDLSKKENTLPLSSFFSELTVRNNRFY